MFRVIASFVVGLLIFGCRPFEGPGPRYVSPNGVTYYVSGEVGVDTETLGQWIDRRVHEWLSRKADWGCSAFTDNYLIFLVASEPIVVYPGVLLSGTPFGGVVHNGDRDHIDVAVNWPIGSGGGAYDPPYTKDLSQYGGYGLSYLPHEWTHLARGAWHP